MDWPTGAFRDRRPEDGVFLVHEAVADGAVAAIQGGFTECGMGWDGHWTGRDGTGPDRIGQDRTGRDGTDWTGWNGMDQTGQDRGQDRTGQDRTGRDGTEQSVAVINIPARAWQRRRPVGLATSTVILLMTRCNEKRGGAGSTTGTYHCNWPDRGQVRSSAGQQSRTSRVAAVVRWLVTSGRGQ